MNKTKKGILTLLGILAVCAVSVLAQPSLYEEKTVFDTGPSLSPYPSIMGVHNGTITPFTNIPVDKIYTYSCRGTGGHVKHIKIWIENSSWNVTATWSGYIEDWHNISFNELFMLYANTTYNYTIETGSYPQIIHNRTFENEYGTIRCTKFIDTNGNTYYDWIPAIRLEQDTLSEDLGYLADDLYNLPEIQDGVSQEEVEAAERIADLMKSPDHEVQQGLQLIEEYGIPPEDQGHWIDFETPEYNT